MRISFVCAMVAIGAVALSARAADPDVSTPQGAQKVMRMAIEKGDEKEVRKLLHATTPGEEKLADALAANTVAGSELFKTASGKWGEDETRKQLIGVAGLPPKASDEEKMKWKIEGDRATLEDTPGEKHVGAGLRKIDGAWKMAMSDITAGEPDARVVQMVSMIEKQTELQKQAKKETDAGKYASASDLRSAMTEKMQALIREMAAGLRAAPATAPASGGAGK